MARKLLAILVAAAMLVGAMAPGAVAASDGDLGVSVSQHDDGTATVTVTNNSTAAPNASVAVYTPDVNATYAGVGEYTTDENGTVSLPAPNETVSVNVTATVDNESVTTTAELVAENETDDESAAFGQRVATFVHGLQNDSDVSQPFGLLVAQFVTTHNPGHAQGPPVIAGPSEDDDETDGHGPPAFVGDDDNETDSGGPPDHAGTDSTETDGGDEGAGGDGGGNGGGPPAHAGNDD